MEDEGETFVGELFPCIPKTTNCCEVGEIHPSKLKVLWRQSGDVLPDCMSEGARARKEFDEDEARPRFKTGTRTCWEDY